MNNENEQNEDATINNSDGNQFKSPDDQASGETSGNEFSSPPSDAVNEDQGQEAESGNLQGVCKQIEEGLAKAAAGKFASIASANNSNGAGVCGVGVSSLIPGQSQLVVYVEDDANQEAVRRELFDNLKVQAMASDDMDIEIIKTGVVEPSSSNRSRFRPAPAGVSVGHFRITAGTIGGWSKGNGSRSQRLLMVSNNHVLADSNNGKFGDAILQPGRADGGRNPQDRIAILERFVAIKFGGPANFVDCATGWCWPNLVRTDHVFHQGSNPRFFRLGSQILEPQPNMLVGKTGRTTNLTQGLIQATNVSINVNFGSAGIAHFRDQFSVRSTNSSLFSQGGDSGSFVWQWAQGLRPVGLLFAGGGGVTFCNRLSRVVRDLDVSLI